MGSSYDAIPNRLWVKDSYTDLLTALKKLQFKSVVFSIFLITFRFDLKPLNAIYHF